MGGKSYKVKEGKLQLDKHFERHFVVRVVKTGTDSSEFWMTADIQTLLPTEVIL